MTEHTTMHRDGRWTVELISPVGQVGSITFKEVMFEQSVRWAEGKIPSTMALMSELSGVPETVLMAMTQKDIDRVLFAYTMVIPATVREDFNKGVRPLITPAGERDLTGQSDPIDPRFPAVDEPVKRLHAVEPETEAGFINKPPEAVRKV